MHWKIKAKLQENAPTIEILNTILEEISFQELDEAEVGDLQAFVDLSKEVRNFCYSRRGVR